MFNTLQITSVTVTQEITPTGIDNKNQQQKIKQTNKLKTNITIIYFLHTHAHKPCII